jgi:hypothetical protein
MPRRQRGNLPKIGAPRENRKRWKFQGVRGLAFAAFFVLQLNLIENRSSSHSARVHSSFSSIKTVREPVREHAKAQTSYDILGERFSRPFGSLDYVAGRD